jgi:dephospho-CoA kinase
VADPDVPNPDPLRMFITGGAGVGKSFIISILWEFLARAHQGQVARPVVLGAPTGVAAFNIQGETIHSALKLPVEHAR